MAYLLWYVVGVVGATFGQIKLPQLHSPTGSNLHGSVSELMAMCWSIFQVVLLGLLVVLQIWRDLFLGVSLAFAGGRGEVVSMEQGCWSGGGISTILL
jgi:uncharacterized membrane protein